jgi:hypothetical protein
LFVRPDTVHVVAPVVVQVALPGEEVTVYPVMGVPPVLAGAVQETTSWFVAVPAAPVTPVGTPGTVAGVRLALGPEAEPVPLVLVAVTENVYGVPATRPVVMTQLVAVATVVVQVPPAGLEVAVYPVIVEPPSFPSVQLTVTWGAEPLATPVALVAVPMVGAWGSVEAVTEAVAPDAGPVPLALVAVTEKVYDVPAVRPVVTVQLVAVATEAVQVPPAGLEVTV